MRSKRLILRFVFGFVLAAPFVASAAPGTIDTSFSSMSPVLIGETFTATFRISGYNDATEIDGFQFKVNYPSNIFSFVGGVNFGDAAGPDQQWLTKPTQDDGFILDATIAPDPGVVTITLLDFGPGDSTTGLQGGTFTPNGFLLAFNLMATGIGTGDITLTQFGGQVLFDTDLMPAGKPELMGASMTVVVPEPGTAALLLTGAIGLLALGNKRRRRG